MVLSLRSLAFHQLEFRRQGAWGSGPKSKHVGPASRGGGIRNEATDGTVSLTETEPRPRSRRTCRQTARWNRDRPATDQVEVGAESTIIKNRLTNCTTGIGNCFG
jgi:hypothetical protein